MEEKIQSHVKEINRQNQGRQKVKHKWRDPGSGVSFSKSNIARAMWGRVPQNSNFLALRSQNEETKIDPPSELTIALHNAPTSALQQVPASTSETTAVKRSSGSNEQSPNYYGFEDTSTDSLITAAPNRRAIDADNFWPPNIPVVETFQFTAEQAPEETNISPVIENVSLADPRIRYLADYRSPTPEDDTILMTVFEAEVNASSD